MKKLLIGFIFLLFKSCVTLGQDDSVRYDVLKPELVYLVGYDRATDYWYVRRIFKVETWQAKEFPCGIVYHWRGNKDSMGFYQYADTSRSNNNSPCDGGGLFMVYYSEYKGDSIINHDCKGHVYSLYKTEYFQPAKTEEWEVGEKYKLKPNEHEATYKVWYPKPIIIMCI